MKSETFLVIFNHCVFISGHMKYRVSSNRLFKSFPGWPIREGSTLTRAKCACHFYSTGGTDALGHTSTINFVSLLCRTKRALNHFSICSHFPAINEHHQRGHRVVRWCYFYIFYRFLRVAQLTKRIKGVKNHSKVLKLLDFETFWCILGALWCL